jgi:hypothetical protein
MAAFSSPLCPPRFHGFPGGFAALLRGSTSREDLPALAGSLQAASSAEFDCCGVFLSGHC